MSPAQAARHAQVSRRTIMRAIESSNLEAFRDNRNRWQIDPAELDRWTGAQVASTEQRSTLAHPDAHYEAALELAAAQATISQLEARLRDTEQDRDHWRSMAAKLADRPPSTPPRRRWWPF